MTPQFIQGVAVEVVKVILLASMPAMLMALVVGLAISILQATTQIQEMTLATIPKMIAIYGTIILFSGFIIERLMGFASGIFSDFGRYVR